MQMMWMGWFRALWFWSSPRRNIPSPREVHNCGNTMTKFGPLMAPNWSKLCGISPKNRPKCRSHRFPHYWQAAREFCAKSPSFLRQNDWKLGFLGFLHLKWQTRFGCNRKTGYSQAMAPAEHPYRAGMACNPHICAIHSGKDCSF